jgi:hypothetical protein
MATALNGNWINPDYGFDPIGALSGAGGLLGGLFSDSSKPYDAAMNQYQDWSTRAQNTQQPYLNAGQGAISDYQKWLAGQQNPSQFINNLMGQYQESPYSQYLQKQSLRAGTNAASASGLSGSTPLLQQLQQNSRNIGSQDQNQWLQNILGINTQYGQGQNNLMNSGQTAANSLTGLYNNIGKQMAEQSYNKEASKQNDFWNTLGGVGSIIGSFL